MQKTDRAPLAPGLCFITGDIDGPFLDTGFDFDYQNTARGLNGRIYLHVPFVQQMGEAVGMVSYETHEQALSRLSEMQEELEGLKREVMEAEAFKRAISTIESNEFRAKRKPGRKPDPEKDATPKNTEPRTVRVTRRKVLSG